VRSLELNVSNERAPTGGEGLREDSNAFFR